MNHWHWRRAINGYLIALLIIVLDQLTKWCATSQLTYGVPVEVTSYFEFTLLHNKGAAFSFLSSQSGWQRWFFAAIALFVSFWLSVWLVRADRLTRIEVVSLAFILGGALGNLIDRVRFGYVVDFLSFHYKYNYWPAFNIADAAICVGAAGLVWVSLNDWRRLRHTDHSDIHNL